MTSREEDNKTRRQDDNTRGVGGRGARRDNTRQIKAENIEAANTRRQRQEDKEQHLHKTRDKHKPPRQDNIPRLHIKADKKRQLDNTTTEDKLKWMEEKCVDNVDKSSSNVVL